VTAPSRVWSLATSTHGRVLVDGPGEAGVFVVCHGYAQTADEAIAAARRIPGIGRWLIVAPQALHRFYTRGHDRVVASWMTRQDRDEAIADNVGYLDAVVARAIEESGRRPAGGRTAVPIVFAGFSQGASMAYRAARLGRHGAAGLVALAGDIPPEVKAHRIAAGGRPWPPVLIGVGSAEEWYAGDRLAADLAWLDEQRIGYEVARFEGGHEWTDAFCSGVGRWLESRSFSTNS
jgi:predicted esterase